jgi:hypothetical protein
LDEAYEKCMNENDPPSRSKKKEKKKNPHRKIFHRVEFLQNSFNNPVFQRSPKVMTPFTVLF